MVQALIAGSIRRTVIVTGPVPDETGEGATTAASICISDTKASACRYSSDGRRRPGAGHASSACGHARQRRHLVHFGIECAAELLGELAFNDRLRESIIAGQRRRVKDFGDDRITRELERLVGRTPSGA
jgi:hypothetical protein